MSGIFTMLMAVMGGAFSAIMTVGANGGGLFGYSNGVYGSMTTTTFIDHGGTTRTISIWNWDNAGVGTVSIRLSGVSIANTDTTFIAIVVNGNRFTRASATYTANDGGGRTLWSWAANTTAYPNTGTTVVSVQ